MRQVYPTARVTLCGVLVCLLACAPGYSVHPVSLSPASVTFEYTHSVSSEYGEVVKRAEAACQDYKKHARAAAPPVRINADRSVVTFDCI